MTGRPILTLPNRLSSARLQRSTPFERRKHDGNSIDRKRFYDSSLWQATREAKLSRDPLCQVCAYENIVSAAGHVDHWQPLAEGGNPTADENLVSMCAPCHSRKTQCEMNGTPYPPYAPSKPRGLCIA
jgi:5-methylcytosine-specific restriction endonuclease McrA